MPTFSDSDKVKLDTGDPRIQLICNEAIKTIAFKVLECHRGREAQHAAFLNGTSQLDWPNGKHNKLPSIAIDVAPLYFEQGARIDWKDIPAFARLMGHLERIAIANGIPVRLGMDWDGDWRTSGYDPNSKFLDAPHLELVTP